MSDQMGLKYYTRRAKRLAKEEEHAAPTLPLDIIFEILILLPVENVLRLKTVCKQWFQLIQDPIFIEYHLYKGRSRLLTRDKAQRPVNVAMRNNQFVFLSSCRGLILQRSVASSKYLIRNPATRQILDLPDPCKTSLTMKLSYAITTGEYKVVNIYTDPDEPLREGCELLTIGDHGDLAWKPLPMPAFTLADSKGDDLIIVMPTLKALHFLRQVTTTTSFSYIQVYSFDLVTDTFSSVMVPTWFETHLLNICPLSGDGCLGIGTHIDKQKKIVSVLLLTDHKQPTWAKSQVVYDLDGLDSADITEARLFYIKNQRLRFYMKSEKWIEYDPIAKKVVSTFPSYTTPSSLVVLKGMRPDTN